jgi:tripartite-type tricarboxylate transporter receptor subunit TctC
MNKKFFRFMLAGAICMTTLGLQAQSYPNRTIVLISPVQAASAGDISTRLIAQKMSENMGQPITIENLPGAAGMIGLDRINRAKPDGYTIASISDSTLTYVPIIQGRKNFDALERLDPISTTVTGTWVLVANPSLQLKSVQDLIAYAKANPGKLNYASAGIGGSHHVVMEMFKSATKTKMEHVPYKGATAAIQDVQSGQVQVMFSALGPVLAAIRDNRLTVLGVSSMERSKILPNIPTLTEAGVPGFTFSTWGAILVPKGTPKTIADKLHAELGKALADPAVVEKLNSTGGTPLFSSPEQLRDLIQSTTSLMSKVIQNANITSE